MLYFDLSAYWGNLHKWLLECQSHILAHHSPCDAILRILLVPSTVYLCDGAVSSSGDRSGSRLELHIRFYPNRIHKRDNKRLFKDEIPSDGHILFYFCSKHRFAMPTWVDVREAAGLKDKRNRDVFNEKGLSERASVIGKLNRLIDIRHKYFGSELIL